jgi:hypothetical protein
VQKSNTTAATNTALSNTTTSRCITPAPRKPAAQTDAAAATGSTPQPGQTVRKAWAMPGGQMDEVPRPKRCSSPSARRAARCPRWDSGLAHRADPARSPRARTRLEAQLARGYLPPAEKGRLFPCASVVFAQRVVTGNRLLMMTLSAVYGNAPSLIPVPPKFSSVGCNGRALTSVFMASIQTQ